jgi:uncharacterized protein YlxW (UPF0749 family)
MQGQQEPIDVRRQRLGLVMRQLAEDLVDERRRRFRLEREVRELSARLASYETASPKEKQNGKP